MRSAPFWVLSVNLRVVRPPEQVYDAFANKLEPQLRRELHQLLQAHTEEANDNMAGSFVQGYRLGARMVMDMLAKE